MTQPRDVQDYEAQARELVALLGNDGRATTLAGYIAAALRAAASERDAEWSEAVRRKLAPHYPCRVEDKTPCPECAPLRALLRSAPADESPPAKAEELVVCEYCPEYPHPLNDDGTKCKFPRPASSPVAPAPGLRLELFERMLAFIETVAEHGSARAAQIAADVHAAIDHASAKDP